MERGLIVLAVVVALFLLGKWLEGRKWPTHVKANEPLDKPLLWLEGSGINRPFTAKMATEGVFCCAELGWGKTWLVFLRYLDAYVRQGMGGFILGAKTEDLPHVEVVFARAGASDRLVVIGPRYKHKVNWFEALLKIAAPGSETEEVVGALCSLLEIEQRTAGKSGGEGQQFFKTHSMALLSVAVTVLRLIGEPINAFNLYRFIITLPASGQEIGSEEWRKSSYANACMATAYAQGKTATQAEAYEHARLYVFEELLKQGERTRGSIISTSSSMLAKLLRGWMRDIWSTTTTVDLGRALDSNVFYYFDTSPLEYGEYGTYSHVMAKSLAQRMIERRRIDQNSKPVALMFDEAHAIFVTTDRDHQAICRQKLGCSWVATQNLTGLFSALGGGKDAESQVKSWVALFGCKIFGTNTDWDTNTYASQLCGQQLQTFGSGNIDCSTHETMWDQLMGNTKQSYGWSERYEAVLRPEEWVRLRKPEPPNYEADAIVIMSRLQAVLGRHWMQATFRPLTKG